MQFFSTKSPIIDEHLDLFNTEISYFQIVYFQNRQRYVLKRRLRVRTVELGLSRNIYELYESADPEVILTILTHKVLSHTVSQLFPEVLLLQRGE